MKKNFIINEENVQAYTEYISAYIKEKVDEANRQGVILGISGGIDSAVVARLCQIAGVKVLGVLLPDGNSMNNSNSMEDAIELINTFDIDHKTINIKSICDEIESQIDESLVDLSKINIRPRVRMSILYALAQNHHSFVIGTGNLSEITMGYFTKWGDGANDLNPLAMLTKTEVRVLAKHLNVPESIINKPPSAGLFEGQTDEDELGFTYEQIDSYILNGTTGNPDIDQKIAARADMSAHKNNPISVYNGPYVVRIRY